MERAEHEFEDWYRTESGVAERPLGRGASLHAYAGAGFGRGLRFNNPFRLERPLGDGGESLSLTAPYFDLTLGVAAGPASSVQHGAVVHLSLALDGVAQQVLSPGYGALLRLSPRSLALARASLPFVLAPELTLGVELGLGLVWLLRAGLGLEAELSAGVFGGAATWERTVTRIPIAALQLALFFDWEVLP